MALGGLLAYGIAKYVKLYGDVNIASLKTTGSAKQLLDKATIAIAVAPNTDFCTGPEVRQSCAASAATMP
jgi:maltoporin